MHAIYSYTEDTYIHTYIHTYTKWIYVQWNGPSETKLRTVHMCALHCTQLLHTILHRTDLIIFPLTLQTITIAPMMSIWGKRGVPVGSKQVSWEPRGIGKILRDYCGNVALFDFLWSSWSTVTKMNSPAISFKHKTWLVHWFYKNM